MYFKNISTSRNFILLLLMSAFIFTVSGCKKEGCTDPTSSNYDPDAKTDDGTCEYPTIGELHFHFHPSLGTSAFAFDTEVTNADGRKIKFSTARFYISNFRLMSTGGGELSVPDEYFQINATTADYHLSEEVPVGSYDGIMFDVGVDPTANLSDPSAWPAGHALSSQSSTFDHWSWNTGYRFIVLEGFVDTTAAMSATADVYFEYHLGLERSRREISISHPFTVTHDTEAEVHMGVDYLEFLADLDLTTDIMTHTMDDSLTAARIANRAAAAITAE
jgi:hypothetical protein